MREQPCRDASAQHTPAVSTLCASGRSPGSPLDWSSFRLPGAYCPSDEVERNPLRPTVAGAASASSLFLSKRGS